MATIEYIKNRIEGKEKEIAKLTKKIERIEKAQATNWEVNPYWYCERDLVSTNKELNAAKAYLADWQNQLAARIEKDNSRNVVAIIEFLAQWKERMTKFHMKAFEEYPAAHEQYVKDMKAFNLGYYEERTLRRNDPEKYGEYIRSKREVEEAYRTNYGFILPYVERAYNPETMRYDLFTFDSEKLDKELTEESNRKYDDIIERTNAVVGTIIDATGLRVGAKGELNGYIIGERGTAKVETIGAGGYNIQCFHFRTLIHKVK